MKVAAINTKCTHYTIDNVINDLKVKWMTIKDKDNVLHCYCTQENVRYCNTLPNHYFFLFLNCFKGH